MASVQRNIDSNISMKTNLKLKNFAFFGGEILRMTRAYAIEIQQLIALSDDLFCVIRVQKVEQTEAIQERRWTRVS